MSILPVKALGSDGSGTIFDVARGIRWAADHGARVINLSVGARLPDFPYTLAEAVQYAQDQGVLIVAAAGNEGMSISWNGGGNGFFPAALPGVLSVGASGQDHAAAYFSNPGALIMAPGVGILSSVAQADDAYDPLSGTSMSAALASAGAALLWSVNPDKSALQVSGALQAGRNGYPAGCTGQSCKYGDQPGSSGHGRLHPLPPWR